MELKVKLFKWSAGLPVAMLNKKTANKIGIHIKDRALIKTLSRPYREISTVIDIAERIVKENEIAVSSEVKKIMGLRVGQRVDVDISPISKSLIFIKKKLNGKSLSEKEINEIIQDVVSNSLSEPETALFISAMYKQGMSLKETIYLTKAILKSGNRLRLKEKFVVDKHSIGGIPGNRTTPIIVSICASAGLIIPKSSSRAITSSAGTADVMETITNVEFSMKELKNIIKKTNACLIWGGSLGVVPADSKIIRIERMLNMDPEAQLLASIMAKKIAMGANYIVIDIPYGKTAKVDKIKAIRLKKEFEQLGRYFRKNLRVFLMETKEPMGSGVGPALELIDVINVLDPNKRGPIDLEEKSLFLAGELLEMTGKSKKGQGIRTAKKILYSGKAFNKFKQIVKAQGGEIKKIKLAKFKKDIFSNKAGIITEINNKKINNLARTAGCPANKFSGVKIHVSLEDKIKKRTKLLTIYSASKSRLKQVMKYYKDKLPIKIS